MTIELITGFTGTPHIGSSDFGAFQAGLVGPGDYALATGDQLKGTMSNATTFALQSGDAVLNGRHVHLTGTTTATVQSGTQGQKRNDIAALRYTRDTATNIETVQLVIIKGTATTGTPADPTHNKGLITDGVSVHDMPLYRIPLNGITVGTLVPLFNVLKPMADVWDSLTPIRSGQKNVTFSGSVADVLSDTEYRELIGRSYTGGDTVDFTAINTGVNTALVACYDTPHKVVRAIQVGTQQNVTMDVRYAVIPAV